MTIWAPSHEGMPITTTNAAKAAINIFR